MVTPLQSLGDNLLSLGDLEEVIGKSRQLISEACDVCMVIGGLNNLRDADVFVQSLDSPHLGIAELNSAQFQALTRRLEMRHCGFSLEQLPEWRAWIAHRLQQVLTLFLASS